MPQPSIRSLAKQLGVSTATVSLALRDSPLVLPSTREKVRQAAQRAGYRPNPLVRSVMAALRRSTHDCYKGSLLALEYTPRDKPALNAYHREVFQGARQRAIELGYSMELAWTGPKILSLDRLNTILRTRRIQGIVVMPFAETIDLSALDCAALATVVIDYCVSAPTFHTVVPDHHLSLFKAVEHLTQLGYRRPGLVLERWRDERIRHRWSAGFVSAFRSRRADPPVPLLIDDTISRDVFLSWFEEHQPDVIVGHLQEKITNWLVECCVNVPQEVGYVQLNWRERIAPCAGLDPRPALLGRAAVDATIALLQRNERGIPTYPSMINLPLEWIDGPTLPQPIARPPKRTIRHAF